MAVPNFNSISQAVYELFEKLEVERARACANGENVEWPVCRDFRIANIKITIHDLSAIFSFNSSLSRVTITRKAIPSNARLFETTFSDSQYLE